MGPPEVRGALTGHRGEQRVEHQWHGIAWAVTPSMPGDTTFPSLVQYAFGLYPPLHFPCHATPLPHVHPLQQLQLASIPLMLQQARRRALSGSTLRFFRPSAMSWKKRPWVIDPPPPHPMLGRCGFPITKESGRRRRKEQ